MTRKVWLAITLCATALIGMNGQAGAQALPFVKAKDLGGWCADGDPRCAGYVAAIADLMATRREACFDVGINVWDLSAAVAKYISETAGVAYMRASEAAEDALARAYPCE